MNCILRVALCIVATALVMLRPDGAWALELQEVLRATAVEPPARVRFREERHNPLLENPLILTGYLEYLGPARMRKVIETPFKEAFLIDAAHIEVEREGEVQRIPLRQARSLQSMLAGIEAVLAGNESRIEKDFRYELGGEKEAWSMRLEPLSRRVARNLGSILVHGDASNVQNIRINLSNGEWQVIELLKDGGDQ
jgi:hypothetical protein